MTGVGDQHRSDKVGHRLTPAMVSRKLQVVSFAKQYLARWGQSPSYGEIAGALKIDRSHARKLVKRAVAEGLLHRATGGRRAIADPDASSARFTPAEAHALIERLHAEGYTVLETDRLGYTNGPLPLVVELDHIPSGDDGDEQDEFGAYRRGGGDAHDRASGAQAGASRAA